MQEYRNICAVIYNLTRLNFTLGNIKFLQPLFLYFCFAVYFFVLLQTFLTKLNRLPSPLFTHSAPSYLFAILFQSVQFFHSLPVSTFTFHRGRKKSEDVVWKMR